MSIHCIQAANASLGESPNWDVARGVLYWIDGERPAVFRWDPTVGQSGHWPMPKPIGCVAPALDGRLIVADAEGLGFLEVTTGRFSRIDSPIDIGSQNRFNDGKVDRAARLWVGTMDPLGVRSTGHLWRLDTDLSLHCLDSGFICSNGLGWSPDNRTMYFTDSVVRTIWAYEFNLATGELGGRHIFARLTDSDGMPDGLTVDSEGFVWSAIWDGWRVVRYAPDGTVDREVSVPVQRPSSCMFGGSDLRTLFITSASVELDGIALKNGPLAGALFAVEPGVAGLPEIPFGA